MSVHEAKLVSWLVCLLLAVAPIRAVAEESGRAEPSETFEVSQESEQGDWTEHVGERVGLDISTGLIGIFAPVNLGVIFPTIGSRLQLGLRVSWSMPAINIAHENVDEEVITYLPWMITGDIFMHIGGAVRREVVRGYFGLEILVGSTFATKGGLISDNITTGAYIFGGMELYLSQRFILFFEGGVSGVFTFEYGPEAELGGISQHGATGFFLRFGPRFLVGRSRGEG
jgi:hypothetical protein